MADGERLCRLGDWLSRGNLPSPVQLNVVNKLPHRTRGHTAGHVNDSKTELSDIYPTAYDMRAAARRIDSITGRGW